MNHELDNDTRDLSWITGQQSNRAQADPVVIGDPFARERARQALVHHIGQGRGRRTGLRGALGLRTLGFALAGGAAALIALALVSSGGSGTAPAGGAHGVTAHVPAAGTPTGGPLMQLADYVSSSPAPSGDSTLVQRTTTSEGKSETAFDLYGDNGHYVFSPTKGGLAEVIAGDTAAVEAGTDGDGGTTTRQLAAAVEADSGDVAGGAEDMASAYGGDPHVTPADGDHYENLAWISSTQAIIAGAGRPEVRAGVLKILATLPGVAVTEGVEAGDPTLVLTSGPAESGPGYTERLTIDATTGVPIEFVGGPTGGRPDTTVDYQVSRASYPGL